MFADVSLSIEKSSEVGPGLIILQCAVSFLAAEIHKHTKQYIGLIKFIAATRKQSLQPQNCMLITATKEVS